MLQQVRPVARALYRPLTVWGVDRRLFFLALLVGAGAFNLFYSLLAGVWLFAALYTFAWWSTRHDPQLLAILLRTAGTRAVYDPAKVSSRRHAWEDAR